MSTPAADFEFFAQYRNFLTTNNGQASGINSSLQLTAYPEDHKHLGIYNQGATCYLNSILQALYYDDWFRNTILSLATEDQPPILRELQRFFAYLTLSENGSVSAVDLITSFGWSKSQMFEQHDAHEFYNVLFDSLGRCSSDLDSKLSVVYEGACKDALTCPKCNHSSEKMDKFINLSVDLPDTLEEPSKSSCGVESLLSTHMHPEVLDADNMWLCAGCNEKVQATKSKAYTKLPDRLVLHLKRFRFDPISRRRRKLNTNVKLQAVLDVSKCLNMKSAVEDTNGFELTSILLHSGTAMGGHYRAFIKCRSDGVWYDFNDTLVTPLSTDEVNSLFEDSASSSSSEPSAAGGEISDRYKTLIQQNAYMLIYDRCNRYAGVKPSSSLSPSEPIPSALKAEIDAVNQEYRSLKRFTDIRSSIYEFSVFLRSPKEATGNFEAAIEESVATTELTFKYGSARGNEYRLEIAVDQSQTMSFVLEKAYNVFLKCGLLTSNDAPLSEVCRLRQYNDIYPDKLGETFGNRLDKPLQSLGCFYAKPTFSRDLKSSSSGCSLLMETRGPDNKPFAELNNKDMRINMILWQDITSCSQLVFDADKNTLAVSPTLESAESSPNSSSSSSSISTVPSVITNYVPRQEIIVPGEDRSSVASLYTSIKEILVEKGVDLQVASINVIHYTERSTFEIPFIDDKEDSSSSNNSGSRLLRRDFGLWPGDCVIVEIIASAAGGASSPVPPSSSSSSSSSLATTSSSLAFAALKSTRSSIILSYNDPNLSTNHPDYDFILETSLDSTLSVVKETIAKALGIDSNGFHVKRSVNGVQLKDDSKTLEEYSIADRGILHLQVGRGCAPGEHLLHFDVDYQGSSSIGSLGDLPASEKMTVAQLKVLLLTHWKEGKFSAKGSSSSSSSSSPSPSPAATSYDCPAGPTMIRLRDGKSSNVIRDDRVLVRCLVGLADGRRIIVQVLDKPEVLSSEDVVVTVRTLSYANKSMSPPLDLILKRSNTVRQLFTIALDTFFPNLKGDVLGGHPSDPIPQIATVLELAKYGMATVPLTLKATSKLKWNEPAWFASAATGANGTTLADGSGDDAIGAWDLPVDRPPMSLRDGAILVLRSKVDYDKAKAAAKASKGGGEDTPPSAQNTLSASASSSNILLGSNNGSGGGSSNISRIRAMSAQGRRNKAKQPAEQGVTIEVLAPSRGGQTYNNNSSGGSSTEAEVKISS